MLLPRHELTNTLLFGFKVVKQRLHLIKFLSIVIYYSSISEGELASPDNSGKSYFLKDIMLKQTKDE